jgi:hypothetical protein
LWRQGERQGEEGEAKEERRTKDPKRATKEEEERRREGEKERKWMQQHEIKPRHPKKGVQGCRDAGQKCLVGGEHGPGEEDPRRDHLLCHLLENIAARELRLDCHDRLGQLLGPVDGAQCPRKSLCQTAGERPSGYKHKSTAPSFSRTVATLRVLAKKRGVTR